MSDETTQIASVLDYLGHQALAHLQDLSDKELNCPLTLPETNTLFALATHLVGAGEFWALAVAGGRTIPRDRLAEFRATGSFSDLTARYERWLAGVQEVLGALVPERMEERVDVNLYRSIPLASTQEVSVREALTFGRPVVASAVGHRPPGCLLFPVGDARALAAQMIAATRLPRDPAPLVPRKDPVDTLWAIYAALGRASPVGRGPAAHAQHASSRP